MPIQLEPRVYETFPLKEIDEKYGVTDEATIITVKAASTAEHEQREKFFARMERRFSRDDDPSTVTLIQTLSEGDLRRLEVWLTLCECNITGEDGKPLFKSKKLEGKPYLDMNRNQFEKAWGVLPKDIADTIHAKVLEVNPMWAGPEGEVS